MTGFQLHEGSAAGKNYPTLGKSFCQPLPRPVFPRNKGAGNGSRYNYDSYDRPRSIKIWLVPYLQSCWYAGEFRSSIREPLPGAHYIPVLFASWRRRLEDML
jgi:hypothetical protein